MGDQLPKVAEKQSRGDSSWERCSMSRLSGGSKTNSSQLQSSSSDKLRVLHFIGWGKTPAPASNLALVMANEVSLVCLMSSYFLKLN